MKKVKEKHKLKLKFIKEVITKIMKKGWATSLPYSVNEGIHLENTNWLT